MSPSVESGPSSGDGVYGRLDGDFDLGVRLGAEYDRTLSPSAGLSLLYFWTVGISANHVFDFGDRSESIERTTVGAHLRPLFLLRWDKDQQTGPAFWDLTLDSLTLGVAAHLPHEAGTQAGPEISLAAGFPLFSTAGGLWLEVIGVERLPNSVENGPALFAFLAWHALWNSGLHSDRPLSGPSD